MANDTVSEVILQDPLNEATRKERRSLLGISVLAIILVKAGIIPTKLTALGVEFGKADQQSLLWVLNLITLYFLIAFLIYAVSDFLAWRIAFINAFRERLAEREFDESGLAAPVELGHLEFEFLSRLSNRFVFTLSRPVSFIRAAFEFVLPVIMGIYSVVLLWKTELPINGS